MDFSEIAGKAKKIIDDRGGTEALKEDADELRGIVEGDGTFLDKAKAAAKAVKEPGAHHEAAERSHHDETNAAADDGGADEARADDQEN